jgi:glycosyltransferase involved in cell wall biosynthesis
MKVLIINSRYGHVSGPERYLFNLKNLLEGHGHGVIPFSINYAMNEPSEYSRYFASPLSDNETVRFKEQNRNFRSLYKTIGRNFYSNEVEKNLSKLIEDTRPDFAIVLLYLRKLSPSVIATLHKLKLPFAVRLSDFQMICPSAQLYRDGHVCQLCVDGSLWNSVKYKCVQDGYGPSLVNLFATAYHNLRHYFDLIQCFVSPSQFTISKMVEGGFDPKKFHHLPTFANPLSNLSVQRDPAQILYSGRLEEDKGVHVLLEALQVLKSKSGIDVKLKLAGNGEVRYVNSLKEYAAKHQLNKVEFLGNLNKALLNTLYEQSSFSVIPSLWYDNLPNSALESFAAGTPLIASRHGSFLELIRDGVDGLLFERANAEDLASKIEILLRNEDLARKMGASCRERIATTFSPKQHYETLMTVIEREINIQYK